MTFKELIKIILNECATFPNVHYVDYGDAYKLLNTNPSVDYAAMIVTHNGSAYETTTSLVEHDIVVVYADRETDDQSNILDIQSEGIKILQKLIDRLNDKHESRIFITDFVRMETFREKFSSEVAGALARLTISAPDDDCFDEIE